MKKTINPPVYFMAFLLLGVLVHFALPVPRLIAVPYTYLGIVGIGFGAIINIWADAVFKRQRTTVKPDERPSTLVTSGPFRISRNPMYLSMLIWLTGLALLLGSLSVFLFPIFLFVMMNFLIIPLEEKSMEESFEERYREYKRHVRRWI